MSDIDDILGDPGNLSVADYWWGPEHRSSHSFDEFPGPASVQRDARRDAHWEGTPQATSVENFRSYARPVAERIGGILDDSGVGFASQFLIPGARGGRGATWKTEVPREGAPTASLDVGGDGFRPSLPPTGEHGPHVLGGLLAKRPTASANANSADVVSIGPMAQIDALNGRIADIERRANQILSTTGSNVEWMALKEHQSQLQSKLDTILLDRVEKGLGDPPALVGPAIRRANNRLADTLSKEHNLNLMRGGPQLDTADMMAYLRRLHDASTAVRQSGPTDPRLSFGVYPKKGVGRFEDGYGGKMGLGVPVDADPRTVESILRAAYQEGVVD